MSFNSPDLSVKVEILSEELEFDLSIKDSLEKYAKKIWEIQDIDVDDEYIKGFLKYFYKEILPHIDLNVILNLLEFNHKSTSEENNTLEAIMSNIIRDLIRDKVEEIVSWDWRIKVTIKSIEFYSKEGS